MGLDVYLKRYDDYEDTLRREREHEDISARLTEEAGGYEGATDRIKAEAVRLNLDEWGNDETHVETVELPSAAYPDHMFKIGYFRSSYNSGGINRVVGALCGGRDLDWIFAPPRDEYSFRPDWTASRKRALQLLEDYIAALKSDGGRLSVRFEAPNHFVSNTELKARCSSDEQAIEIFRKERAESAGKEPDSFGDPRNYSNLTGTFYLGTPLTVLGWVDGIGPLGERGLFMIVDAKGDDGEKDWYQKALEVVVETCDWVLAQPNIEQYRLSWSG